MLAKKKWIISAMILLVLAALTYGEMQYVTTTATTPLAEGYLLEADNRLLFAKVVAGKEDVAVKLYEAKVETSNNLPVIKSNSYAYSGSLEKGNLILKTLLGQPITATVNEKELTFHGQTEEGYVGETKLLASQSTTYNEKLEAMKKRVSEQTAQIQKQTEEKKAQEAADQAFGEKVQRTSDLQVKIAEDAKKLSNMIFSEEQTLYEEHLTELQRMVEELSAYAQKPDLHDTDYATMETMVGGMEVQLGSLAVVLTRVEDKKKAMNEIMATLQKDMDETKVLWDQIKDEIPGFNSSLQAYNEAMKTGFDASEQAKARMAETEKQQSSIKEIAEGLYKKAEGILSQTKAKYNF
ncbi:MULTISPECIES: hypothetical protein [Brevibacillus]|uniref:hypothetical protein n=1 Tax=Brevibacillus TaxID=55080 RepID=UPI000EEB51CF|nr:hypothetical protein [Brevibacillus sp.]HBZ80246.1 hypothetical protein [Brevibacillus sp.]